MDEDRKDIEYPNYNDVVRRDMYEIYQERDIIRRDSLE